MIRSMSRNGPKAPRLPLNEEIARPTFRRERSALKRGVWPVAGCDEAGRGPLAGPVVAAAVILDPDNVPRGLDDSKRLTPERREVLYERICARARPHGARSSCCILRAYERHMRLGIGSAGKAVVPVSDHSFPARRLLQTNQYLWNAVSSVSLACPFVRTPDFASLIRATWVHAASQNRSSCSAAGSGGRKCSVVVFTVVVLKPSRSQATSKRRPIIQAMGPVPVMRVPKVES